VTLRENGIDKLMVGMIVMVAIFFGFLIAVSVRPWKATGQLARIDGEADAPAFEVIR